MRVRPLLAFRDYHGLQRSNDVVDRRFGPAVQPYSGLPAMKVSGGRTSTEGQGWYFATETARILGGAGGALLPADGARLLRETTTLEVP